MFPNFVVIARGALLLIGQGATTIPAPVRSEKKVRASTGMRYTPQLRYAKKVGHPAVVYLLEGCFIRYGIVNRKRRRHAIEAQSFPAVGTTVGHKPLFYRRSAMEVVTYKK